MAINMLEQVEERFTHIVCVGYMYSCIWEIICPQ